MAENDPAGDALRSQAHRADRDTNTSTPPAAPAYFWYMPMAIATSS